MIERQKEIAMLRTLGASPKPIVLLVILEALMMSILAPLFYFAIVTLMLTLLVAGWPHIMDCFYVITCYQRTYLYCCPSFLGQHLSLY